MAVAVPLADTAISAMDEQFTLLVLRDLTTCVDGSALGLVLGGHPRVALAAYCPIVIVFNYVLVFTHRVYLLVLTRPSVVC